MPRRKNRNDDNPTSAFARGGDRRYTSDASPCVSPTACRPKRTCTYESCTRLESCTRDPIGYEGSQWNLYEYVGSDPVDRVDPSGQSSGNCTLVGPTGGTFTSGFGAAAGLGPDFAINPGVWDFKPTSTLLCCAQRFDAYAYACCCDGKRTGRRVSVAAAGCFTHNIAPNFLLIIRAHVPIKKLTISGGPGVTGSFWTLHPSDQSEANTICKAAATAKGNPGVPPANKPPQTIPCDTKQL